MVIKKVSKSPLLKLTSLSNNSLRKFSAVKSEDLFEVLEEKAEEDIGYEQWLASTKEALKNTKGRFWLGKNSVSLVCEYLFIFSLFLIIQHSYRNLYFRICLKRGYSSSLSKTLK